MSSASIRREAVAEAGGRLAADVNLIFDPTQEGLLKF
jgi:hypothetical protein